MNIKLLKTSLIATILMATTIGNTATSERENITVIKKDSVIENSSEYNRSNKSFLITAQPIGFAVAPVPSSGVNIGYYFNRNNLLQLEVSKGTLKFSDTTTSTSSYYSWLDFEVPATTVGLNLKHFFGNSFYTKTGLAYRKIGLSNVRSYGAPVGTSSDVGSAESLTADIAIGNQWQWDNFTMGCDWIGIMAPISKINSRYTDDGFSTSDKKELQDSWDRLANVTSSQMLRFYMGVSF